MNLDQQILVWEALGVWFAALFALGNVIAVGFSALVIVRQLRVATRVAERDEVLKRFDMFSSTTEIDEDSVRAAEVHWPDHFDATLYQEFYEGDSEERRTRRRSYVLMKRKYWYLLFQAGFTDDLGRAAQRWLEYLVDYQEFRHVHQWSGRYYPEFRAKVDKLIKERGCEEPIWMYASAATVVAGIQAADGN